MSVASATTPAPTKTTPGTLRLAMLGMIEGNGHPYSWSAIINGYDPEAMAGCPYPVIPKYLGAQPLESVRIPEAKVTHIWTDNPADAVAVAKASLIPNVVSRPEDVIGEVDGVFISTDDGFDHARRAKPFVEAGLPVFIDKPMATSLEELQTFVAWEKAGGRILSSSSLRYAPELVDKFLPTIESLGALRWISGISVKDWEKYGIHMLEPLYRIVGPGFQSIRLESQPGLEVAHLQHASGTQLTVPVISDGGPSFGMVQVCGTKGQAGFRFSDTYTNFRRQMCSFVDYVQTGERPFPFAHTIELMALLIAGLRSRAENSRRVAISEILNALYV